LTTLPDWFQKLTGLQTLDLSYNNLTTLPDWFQKLTGLRYIDISYNSFQTLPLELLPFLQKLQVSTDNVLIADVGKEFIEQGWEAIEQHYIETSKKSYAPNVPYIAELKVMIIGNGGSGKTCISKALKNNNYNHPDHTEEPATVGIELRNIEHDFGGEKWLLRMWDLGGQAAYAATQTMFMTDETLYLVVVDARTETKPDIYLHYIQALVPNASTDDLDKKLSPPVIMVINKIDENNWFGLNKHHLKSVYSQVQDDIVRFSCVTKRAEHEAELFAAIEKILLDTKDPYGFRKKQWGSKWLAVRRTLMEHLSRNNASYISKDQYEKMCDDEGELTEKARKFILTGCVNLGMVFAPIAQDENACTDWIMHAQWITRGINKIFKLEPANSYERSRLHAYMQNNENEDTYNPDETIAILGALKDGNLAFEENGKFIIPALLPEAPPKDDLNKFPEKSEYSEWQMPKDDDDDQQSSEIRFRYPFLHPKIKQVFMVELYRKDKNPILYKYGACWYQDNVRVVMKEDGNDLVFYLKCENAENSRAYEKLCEVQKYIQTEMNYLHKKFKINKGEMLHIFRTDTNGKRFAEYPNEHLKTLHWKMKVTTVPLPSIERTISVERILKGSNEAQTKEELKKTKEKGDTINIYNEITAKVENGGSIAIDAAITGKGTAVVHKVSINDVIKEVQTATSKINQMDELSKTEKNDLIILLNQLLEATKAAAEEEDENKKAQCKSIFEKFKEKLGKHGEKVAKVIEVLSQCAIIAGVLK
jgi:small GTP-binding protein